MTIWTPLQKQLIGALIGLSRTSFSNPKSENTDALVLRALACVRTADDTELTSQIRNIAEEKNVISPGCASCQNPCGNTDDYDMNRILQAEDDVRQEKCRLLSSLLTLAERMNGSTSDEKAVLFVFRALSVLSWDWEAELLQPVADECAEWVQKF